jgi:hypothetical protein
MFNWLYNLIQQLWDASKEFIKWVPLWIYDRFLEALHAVLLGIPVPDCISTLGHMFSTISPNVMYWLGPVHFDVLICVVVCAYTVRFCIRRIPFIG